MTKVKSRKEMASELGISTKTLSRWIKKHQLDIPSGLLLEKHQKLILDIFGRE
jgi:transcriptional regulator with XRE-family HTH domain